MQQGPFLAQTCGRCKILAYLRFMLLHPIDAAQFETVDNDGIIALLKFAKRGAVQSHLIGIFFAVILVPKRSEGPGHSGPNLMEQRKSGRSQPRLFGKRWRVSIREQGVGGNRCF